MADKLHSSDRESLREHDKAAEGGRDRSGSADYEKDNPRKAPPGNPPEELGTKDRDKAPTGDNVHAAAGDKHPEGRDQEEPKPLKQKAASDSTSSAKRATDDISGHQRPGNHPEATLPPENYGRAHPVQVDGTNRRTDDDALQGHHVDVIRGKHKGRKGVFLDVSRYDQKDGFPEQIVVRTNDHVDGDEYIGVEYKDVRNPAARGGHR